MIFEPSQDWHLCIVSNDVEGFLRELERRWRASNKRFKHVQMELVTMLEERKVSPTLFMAFVSSSVQLLIARAAESESVTASRAAPGQSQLPDKWEDPPKLLNRENPWKPTNAPLTGTAAALCHLLLETVPPPLSLPSNVASPEVQAAAARLFNTCLQRRNARLAVKVAGCYGLRLAEQGAGEGMVAKVDKKLLTQSVQDMLENRQLVGPAVGLLMHFPGLAVQFSPVEAMLALISDGQLSMTQKWAAELGPSTQEELIQACINGGNLRDACLLVKEWNLTADFPNLESQYQQRTMQRLLGKALWGAAAGYAIGKPAFQRQLVTALAVEGEHALADEYCSQFGLDPEGLPLRGEALAQSRAARDATFHQLALAADRVHFVDTDEGLALASRRLQNASVIGMDVEWRPDMLGQKCPASIIQIATAEDAFIFDLIELHHKQELDQLLTRLLRDSSIVKLSMDGSQDLKKLAGSYPEMQAFQEMCAVLNMIHLWLLFMRPDASLSSSFQRRQVGLSSIAAKVMGKPLDKSMQLSDWGQRPLSNRQLRYAALDAFVMVEVWSRAKEAFGAEAHEDLLTHCITISRPKRKESEGAGIASEDAEAACELRNLRRHPVKPNKH